MLSIHNQNSWNTFVMSCEYHSHCPITIYLVQDKACGTGHDLVHVTIMPVIVLLDDWDRTWPLADTPPSTANGKKWDKSDEDAAIAMSSSTLLYCCTSSTVQWNCSRKIHSWSACSRFFQNTSFYPGRLATSPKNIVHTYGPFPTQRWMTSAIGIVYVCGPLRLQNGEPRAQTI